MNEFDVAFGLVQIGVLMLIALELRGIGKRIEESVDEIKHCLKGDKR